MDSSAKPSFYQYVFLLLINLMPVYGALFLNWHVFDIVFLFWLENVIIGFFAVLRMMFNPNRPPLIGLLSIFPAAFFVFHYGMFCYGHGTFVFSLFVKVAVSRYVDLIYSPMR